MSGQTAPDALLAIDQLTVDYGGRRSRTAHRALECVSLHVAPGETVGLVGESGSGKSTIARAVLGLAPVTSGTITFGGQDSASSCRVRRWSPCSVPVASAAPARAAV